MDTLDHDPNRPRSLQEMAGSADWSRLQALVRRSDPPHVILTGSAGTGKSCALRLVLGSQITMWLRCSQDPTLRDNRDRIKQAARRRVPDGQINWIILEHADLLHSDAQAFLRRIIETSIGSSRFVLEVRDVAAIAEPLLSRTVLFTGPSLLPYEIAAEIQRRVPDIDPVLASRLASQSQGNIRWAVLQALAEGDCLDTDARSLPLPSSTETIWSEILHCMEVLQRTGSSPRAWLEMHGCHVSQAFERAGGACPWALFATAVRAQNESPVPNQNG